MGKREKIVLTITDILLFLLIIYPIFRGGIVGGYDPGFHMGRIQTLTTNIASGHFPNPIGFEYLNKLGYGVGFFYGNFLLYPFALLHLLGLSLYRTYIVYIAAFVFLNIFSINFVTFKLFNDSWATIFSGPIYLCAYYFITVIYTRAAIGELTAFAIIPWILLSIFKIVSGKYRYWWMFAIAFSLLLVSHVLSFLITAGAAIFLCLFNLKNIFHDKKMFGAFCKGTLSFLGLSSVFLFPFVQQYLSQHFVSTAVDSSGKYLVLVYSQLMKNHFFDPSEFIAMNGLLFTILLVAAILYFLFKKRSKMLVQSILIICLFSSLILSTALLTLVVKLFKPMILLQVVTRVNVVVLPLGTFLIADFLSIMLKKVGKLQLPLGAVFLVVVALITLVFPIKTNLKNVAMRKGPINPLSISMGEYEPQDFQTYELGHNFRTSPKSLANEQKYQIVQNNHFQTVVKITNNEKSRTVLLPRLNYRGYRLQLNYNGKSIDRAAATKDGLVATRLPQDFKNGTVKIYYQMTTVNKAGWAVSCLTLFILILGLRTRARWLL